MEGEDREVGEGAEAYIGGETKDDGIPVLAGRSGDTCEWACGWVVRCFWVWLVDKADILLI